MYRWFAACCVFAAALVLGQMNGMGMYAGIFKQLASTCFIMTAWTAGAKESRYGKLILVGLCFSWWGDAFLIKGGDLFENDNTDDPPLGTKNETGNHTAIDDLSINGTLGGGMGLDGDYNDSGQVEQGDLDLVLLNWGDPVGTPPAGWTNPDFPPTPEAIDQDDLDGVLLNWGNTAAVANMGVVPEPASGFLLLIGGLWLGRLRRNG